MVKQLTALLTLAAMVFGPASALAVDSATVNTGMTYTTGGGTAPIVEVKWEMYKNGYANHGNAEDYDYSNQKDPGAEFEAPGIWGEKMEYTVCAIISDTNGVDSDMEDGVVDAHIYYPENRPMHTYTYDPVKKTYVQTEDPDNPSSGCGVKIEKNQLKKIVNETEAYNLFCGEDGVLDSVKNKNRNLPIWNPERYISLDDMYNKICGPLGMLKKDQARIYCDDKYLIWEDPAGEYIVDVTATDDEGMTSKALHNTFTYKANKGFEVDFDKVAYGEVLFNNHKVVPGDRTWFKNCESLTTESSCLAQDGCNWLADACVEKPTIRNTGNTRLTIGVAQDDMGVWASDTELNYLQYDARIGSDVNYAIYYPFKRAAAYGDPTAYRSLAEVLDLSEVEEMDFSILLKNSPTNGKGPFSGQLWLNATEKSFDDCCSQYNPNYDIARVSK